MPAAVVAIGFAIGQTAMAVYNIATLIASTVGKAVAGIVNTIGPIVGAIGNNLAGIAEGLGKLIGGVTGLIGGDLLKGLTDIAGNIGETVKSLSAGLTKAIEGITLPVTKTVETTTRYCHRFITSIVEVIDEPATAILSPIKATLVGVKNVVDAIKAPIDALLAPVVAIRETIRSIYDLKILADIITGHGRIAQLVGPIAEGKSVETAQAIIELSRSIAETTITTMDKVNTESRLMAASIDAFDERIKTSVKEMMELTKAEVLAMTTPKLTTLGAHQTKVISVVAKLSRHIEDEAWFAAMLFRSLP